MKKLKKSTWLISLLLVYVTAMAVYFLPRNTQTGDMEKKLTVLGAYVIVALLWFVLRRKERLAAERERDIAEADKKRREQNQSQKIRKETER